MSSIPRCDAASISTTSSDVPAAIAARVTRAVGIRRRAVGAVQSLREDARERRLAGAARACEEVRLAHVARRDGVLERPNDRLLADHVVEPLRTIFAVERRQKGPCGD